MSIDTDSHAVTISYSAVNKKRICAVVDGRGHFELSELLANLESLSLRFEQAKKEFKGEAVLLAIADEIESTLAEVRRHVGSPPSWEKIATPGGSARQE